MQPDICPNLRWQETKKGGFLGFGAQGYNYCSCNNAKLDYNFVNNCCKKCDIYSVRPNENAPAEVTQFIGDKRFIEVRRYPNNTCYDVHRYAECNQFRAYGIKN